MSLEFRLLKYFVTVAEELHFGRAAARLYVSQPALSRQIRQFERDLGVTLFTRTTRRVELTPAGRILLNAGRSALEQLDHAVTRAQAAERQEVGHLSVALMSSMARDVIPRAVSAFRAGQPGVGLSLDQVGGYEQFPLVRDGRYDAGVLWRLVDLPAAASGLVVEVLDSQQCCVALPAAHRLAGRRAVELGELAGERWVAAPGPEDRGHRAELRAFCERHGFVPRVHAEASGIDTLLGLVRAGFGVCVAPAVVSGSLHDGVVVIPIAGERMTMLAVRPAGPASPVLARFLDSLREASRSVLAPPATPTVYAQRLWSGTATTAGEPPEG